MKLVYLDTSNFSLLAETQQQSPERFKSFLKTWRERNYILALSEANIFEIARNGFNESRYNLLKEFRPIRFEGRIFPKELVKAFKRKGIYDFYIRDYDFYRPMFYEVIRSNQRLHYLCNSPENGYQILASRGYELSEISWNSKKNFPFDKNQKKLRLKDLSELPTTEFKNYLEKIIPFLERDNTEHAGIKQIKYLYSRLDEVGLQQAFAELGGIDITKESNLNKPFNDLSDRLLFENRVNYFLSQMLYDNEERINFFVDKILIEDCPGEWLKQQVEHQLEKSHDFETNNQLDIKHISHLPYVDILITDKRIVEVTTQVFRSKDLLPSLKKVSLPKKNSNSMESLENVLFK